VGTFAGKPPGSGANFAKLKGTLAARGAHNPGALAAWIGRRKYGKKGFARLSHHSNLAPAAIMLADAYQAEPGETVRCPHCGAMNSPDAKYCDQCGYKLPGNDSDDTNTPEGGVSSSLQTPARGDYGSRIGFSPQQVAVSGSSSPGTAGGKALTYANGGGKVIELASRRIPVVRPDDLVVSRSKTGSAIIRHRRGGDTLGEIQHRDDGKWVAVADGGKELSESAHQRNALLTLIRTWNTGATTLQHAGQAAAPVVQPPPQQTPLMQRFGIPAIRLATPAEGASDGPRSTESSADGVSGLSPRGATIYKKLIKRGFPADRARKFAMRAQNFGGAG
jgi:zinc-ribbon domain